MTLDVVPISPALPARSRVRPADRLGLFVAAAALVLATAGVLILYGLRSAGTADLIARAERDNVAVGRALANLVAADRGLADLAATDSLPAAATGAVHHLVAMLTDSTPFIRVKLFSINGRTVFDSADFGLGEDKTAHFHYQEARHGRVVSKLVLPGDFEDPALRAVSDGYVATYIPYPGPSGTGVLELYVDVTRQRHDLDRSLAGQGLVVGGGLLAAFAALAMVAARLGRAMRHEQDARLASARSAARAEAANAAKVRFLASMSHELRTPLTAIIGFSEILKSEQFGPLGLRYRDYAGSIHASGIHLLNLVDDVLETTRIESGRVDLRLDDVDVARLVAETLAEIAGQAERAQLGVAAAVDPAIGTLRTDAGRLKQALLNIMSNAIKFTYAGGSIRLAATRDPAAVRLTVSDTGIGMRPEDIPVALTPFGQVESPFARRHPGTGLGLPLARNLVELLGGRFEIASEPGRGTVVTIVLPA